MRIYLETFGCQMNRLDSELVVSALRAAGHEMTADRESADMVLFNTCSVRDHAEQKVHSRLGAEVGRKRNERPRLMIGVLGCMAQREGAELLRRYDGLDIVCAPGQLAALPELIEAAAAGALAIALDPPRGAPPAPREDHHNPSPDERAHNSTSRERRLAGLFTDDDTNDPASLRSRLVRAGAARANPETHTAGASAGDFDELDLSRDPSLTPGPAQAYVRISRGCNRFCTYCVVPYVRGPEVSRDPSRIEQEVRRLVGAGRSEITLLGQTVNRYRWRRGELTVRFSDLLERLSGIDGLRRLRFVTSHPVDFVDDVLEAMRDLPNVCEYLHVPAQSGSDAVLKRMNRGYTRADYDALIDRARAIVPGVVVAGDFIVGFPGETDEDHAASVEMIRRSGYKNCFIFRYSTRPGTSAAEHYADDVPQAVKRRRHAELLAVQEEVSLAHHAAYVGRNAEVLVEGRSVRADKQPSLPPPGWTQLSGRTRWDHIVVFDGPEKLAGQYVHVEIAAAGALNLFGRLGIDRNGPQSPR